jgi:hypothetical protein
MFIIDASVVKQIKEYSDKVASFCDTEVLLRCTLKVQKILGDEKSVLWFHVENPMLGGVKPLSFFFVGRGHKVEQFIDAATDEGGL